MRKILVTASAAILPLSPSPPRPLPQAPATSISLSGSAAPGWGPGWGPGYGYGYGDYGGGGIYIGNPYPQNNWAAHVDWCFDHKGPSYNPNTNKYINQYGHKKICHSPFA